MNNTRNPSNLLLDRSTFLSLETDNDKDKDSSWWNQNKTHTHTFFGAEVLDYTCETKQSKSDKAYVSITDKKKPDIKTEKNTNQPRSWITKKHKKELHQKHQRHKHPQAETTRRLGAKRNKKPIEPPQLTRMEALGDGGGVLQEPVAERARHARRNRLSLHTHHLIRHSREHPTTYNRSQRLCVHVAEANQNKARALHVHLSPTAHRPALNSSKHMAFT